MQHLLGLIVLEGERALRVHVLLGRLGRSFDGTIGDGHTSPGTAVSHHSQSKLTNAFHQLDVSFGEAEHAAVIVVEDHHGRQAR